MRQTLRDIDDVLRIIKHPSCFNSAKDDTETDPESVAVTILRDSQYIVLKPYRDTLFLFKRVNMITFEMHVMIIKGPARKRGVHSAALAAQWLFSNTDCQKIITHIPEYHLPSLMFAKVCGLVQEGLLKGAYMKDGQLRDLVILGSVSRDKQIELINRTLKEEN